ncbi:E3 ubiquitin-protein ligase ATL42 [Ananas comosus]|uniref:RING-type E3 ubiquitin transferase n=1 Tax=Ananas comosus TaxID=4615 RepID=A0A199VRP0_ANACO|nr:E3 ubiquitin-protein ligase ATL42 [Ananas comosus]
MSWQLLIASFAVLAAAQTGPTEDTTLLSPSPPSGGMAVSFRPSVAVVIGIFVIMFSLTFLLLMYAKFCHPAANLFASPALHPDDAAAVAVGSGGLRSSSGIDKTVVESLPFFRFSALRGDRGGLECAVCLSRYDDAELLRLLPGCRHAFHLECIDRWLDAHSSCPLCRTKISAAAAARFNQSGRFDSGRDLLGLFVEREPEAAGDLRRSSSRFSIGGSFRRTAAAAANTTPPPKFSSNNNYCTLREAADEGGGSEQIFDKFKHKIVVSDVVFQSRWSDVNSADLIALSSDMLRVDSGQRFSGAEPIAPAARAPAGESVLKIREEMERKRLLESKATKMSRAAGGDSAPTDGWNSTAMISPGARSMSEITNLSRFRGVRDLAGGSAEEKVHRLWLPIVRRTVHWFAGREQRPPPSPSPPLPLPPPPPELGSAHSKEVTDLGAIV